jgi:hypothetical protein
MKNNEWNIPSDYFEKNKKALMPVRKFPTGKWLLALAAACFVGIGLFMWKGEGQTQEVAQGKRREEKVREGKNGEDIGSKHLSTKEDVGAKYLSPEGREGKIENEKQNENENESLVKRGEEKGREGKSKEEVVLGLKEIPREELVAYLLEEDTDLIENIN